MGKQEVLHLGESGETLPWAQFTRLRECARRFYDDPVDSSPYDVEPFGVGRQYSQYVTNEIWGYPVVPEDMLRRCFESGLIGADRHFIEDVLLAIHDFAKTDIPVMICGETGTGKELVAKLLHDEGSRSNAPFVAVNCAGIPSQVLASELFGHLRGAFTGANWNRAGCFEQANKGTIFLDEIGDMPVHMQATVLRFLNDKRIVPVGARKAEDSTTVDVRVICATNKRVNEVLRPDLCYRLMAAQINLWPLLLRPGDLPILAYYFVAEWNKKNAPHQIRAVASNVLEEMLVYRWPGNVRELRSMIERACNAARHRARNKDVLAGLDVVHVLPHKPVGTVDLRDFVHVTPTRIELAQLLCLDWFDFMAADNRTSRFLGLWTMPDRWRRLQEEVQQDEVQPSSGPPSRPVPTGADRLQGLLSIGDCDQAVAAFTRAYVRHHYSLNGRNKTQTGDAIGIHRQTVARYVS